MEFMKGKVVRFCGVKYGREEIFIERSFGDL